MSSAAIAIPSSPHGPALARDFAARCLHAWDLDHIVDRVLLTASELVTNAVEHGQAPVTVRLSVQGPCVRLEVGDGNRLAPALRIPGANGGFGLHLVREMCGTWGVTATNSGKVVWCEYPSAPVH